ncbi:SEC-C metal-binding domain-containing protein [Paenibacillus eucommiae]|uniref:Uncharacterized protein n=1 Tax=Paenibacillus eucommiae TaxID=1355755 RepID=A0ABS4J3C6_9BACL|nr:SEC-C metal-binding domain-containing protein [Paenibacillus eucommiae]MBP1994305.1 hypothetical protein [Paenibacillus eucommiae]
MHYASLYEFLPEIAEKETRTVSLNRDYSDQVPSGNYGLIEYYCIEPKCDCRRVMLYVMSERERSNVAVINFGWESRRFYEKWLGDKNEELIMELKGPCLNTWSPQSSYAQELLTIIKDVVLKDAEYINRLKKHYDMLKRKIKTQGDMSGDRESKVKTSVIVGRNDPCTCGSGKKYKKCCGA